MGDTSSQQVFRGQDNYREHGVGVAQKSIEHGVDSDLKVQDELQMTPSRLQSNLHPFQTAILLLPSNHGTNLHAGKDDGKTPLCQEIEGEYFIQGDCICIIQCLTRAP